MNNLYLIYVWKKAQTDKPNLFFSKEKKMSYVIKIESIPKMSIVKLLMCILIMH